jgi:DNA-binding NarL/FixJ family response regulator
MQIITSSEEAVVDTMQVLIADDAPHTRSVLRAVLEDRGIFRVVDEAATGREAIALAAVWQPDAVVLDESMPELTGMEAMPLIRAVAPNSRIVIYSSHDPASGDEVGRGADAMVDKTRDPAVLVATMCRVLGVDQRVGERRRPGSTHPDRDRRRCDRRQLVV